MLLFLALIGIAEASTCYVPKETTKPYDIITKTSTESQRGCEVQCDADPKCAGISINNNIGVLSNCILLANSTKQNQICSAQTTIFLKQTDGCPVRTDLTAEFGVDPCIDEVVPSAFRGFGVGPICVQDRNLQYIIRAVDSDGRRITLDNENDAKLVQSGTMWAYTYYWGTGYTSSYTKYIVAAVCATAGSVKCPCQPLGHISNIGYNPNYPAVPDMLNPCGRPAWLYYDQVKNMQIGPGYLRQPDEQTALVKCKAGMWMLYRQRDNNVWGVTALSCY